MEYDSEYTNYQLKRSGFRKFVRRMYLASARSKLSGPTLDFGCGVGELLKTLPNGSQGLEYNKETVAYCRANGLHVDWYDGFADNWQMSPVMPDKFDSMVLSHVLEHLDSPMSILRQLLETAAQKGIRRILIIVPGKSGFSVDPTHRTFVDLPMLLDTISGNPDWHADSHGYFPFPFRWVGDIFPYNELQISLVRSKVG